MNIMELMERASKLEDENPKWKSVLKLTLPRFNWLQLNSKTGYIFGTLEKLISDPSSEHISEFFEEIKNSNKRDNLHKDAVFPVVRIAKAIHEIHANEVTQEILSVAEARKKRRPS